MLIQEAGVGCAGLIHSMQELIPELYVYYVDHAAI